MFGSGTEGFIIKFTLGTVFLGVTLIFIGKIGALFWMAGKIKLTAFGVEHEWILKAIELLKAVKP
jgi:hypothetical protein